MSNEIIAVPFALPNEMLPPLNPAARQWLEEQAVQPALPDDMRAGADAQLLYVRLAKRTLSEETAPNTSPFVEANAEDGRVMAVHGIIRFFAERALDADHTTVARQALRHCAPNHDREPLVARGNTAHLAGRILLTEGKYDEAAEVLGKVNKQFVHHGYREETSAEKTLFDANRPYFLTVFDRLRIRLIQRDEH